MEVSDEQTEKFELIQSILSYLGKKERYEEYIADFKRKTEESKKKHKSEASALLDQLKKIELDVQAVRELVGDVTLKELVTKQAQLKQEIIEQKEKYKFLKKEIERLTLSQNWFKLENELKSRRKQEIELLLTKRSLSYLIQQPQKTGDCFAQFQQVMKILTHILFERDLQTLSETTDRFKKDLNDAIKKAKISQSEQQSKDKELSLLENSLDQPKLSFLQEKLEFFKKAAEDSTSNILENPFPPYLNLDPAFSPLVAVISAHGLANAPSQNSAVTNLAGSTSDIKENLVNGHLFEYFLSVWIVNDCVYPMFGKYIRDVFADALAYLISAGSQIGQYLRRGLSWILPHQWDWLKDSATQNKNDPAYKELDTMITEIEAQLAANLDKNICWKLFVCRALNTNSLSKWLKRLLSKPNEIQKKVNLDYFPANGDSLIFRSETPDGKKLSSMAFPNQGEESLRIVHLMIELISEFELNYPKICLSTDPNPDHLNFALKWEKSQQ